MLPPALVMAGGVAANQRLRERLDSAMAPLACRVCYPPAELCTDNGTMIAFAGCQRLLAGQHDGLTINARPRWPMNELEHV